MLQNWNPSAPSLLGLPPRHSPFEHKEAAEGPWRQLGEGTTGGLSLASWWLRRWHMRWAEALSSPHHCQVSPAHLVSGVSPANALERGGGQSGISLLTVTACWCLSLCTVIVICYCIGTMENTGGERLYSYQEEVQHPWPWVGASSMDTKLAHITLPVASSHEAPMKTCHCSSICQPCGTYPALRPGQCTRVPAWVRGYRRQCWCLGCRGEGEPLLQSGARSPLLQRFFLPHSPPSAGSLSDVMGWCGAAPARTSSASENPGFHHYRPSARPGAAASTARHPPALFTGIPGFWLFTSFS